MPCLLFSSHIYRIHGVSLTEREYNKRPLSWDLSQKKEFTQAFLNRKEIYKNDLQGGKGGHKTEHDAG